VVLNDFAAARYQKAVREGTVDAFLANEKYGQDMAAAILYAKGGKQFGEFDAGRWYTYMQAHPDVAARYYGNDPAAKKKLADAILFSTGVGAAMDAAKVGGKFDAGKYVEYILSHPALLAAYRSRYPDRVAKWLHTREYIRHISVWGKLVGKGNWTAANAAWDHLPQWVKDEYYSKHPGKRHQAQQTSQYLGYMQHWVHLFDAKDKTGAMKYFNSLPQWARDRYYAKHPQNRMKWETDAKMWAKLSNYFATDKANQDKMLAENPDLVRWLAKNATDAEARRAAIMNAYAAIPKDQAFLKKVFRDKYPDIFSQQALGDRKLQTVAAALSKHPEMSASFEKFAAGAWATYTEMLKHVARPLSSYVKTDRKVPARKFVKSLSAADASK
jgi:hypothetical protein